MDFDAFLVPPGQKIKLKDYDPKYTKPYKDKSDADGKLEAEVKRLAKYQDVLYAQNTYAILIILQAIDAAGKDSTIRYVMSGVNPQGCQVHSFKAPSTEELDHDYLWRSVRALPERGCIGIFNRSYYEEVLVVRVHPELLEAEQLPEPIKNNKQLWQQRYEEINNFEKYLVNNGIVVIKFFLHVSKQEQQERLLERIKNPDKNWKFDTKDLQERKLWHEYMQAYEDMLNHTSTEHAPWYVIPADRKWFTRLTVADIICTHLKALNLHYPHLDHDHQQRLAEAEKMLELE